MKKTIAVALSGGVDSAVAALLLRDQGHAVVGVTMDLGIPGAEDGPARRCSPRAVEDARQVCRTLGMEHRRLDFSGELERKVIRPFVEAYLRGQTPNPCVECNRFLKFGLLLQTVRTMGWDCLATGHYARLDGEGDALRLRTPRDADKDQTYFLWAVGREELRHVLFPLARHGKDEIRKMAAEASIPVSEKPDSQDICFFSRGMFPWVVHRYAGREIPPGDIVDREGRVLGRHRGLPFYTVGQRGGLGIAHRVPLYVLALDAAANRVVVGERSDVRSRGLVAGQLNLLGKRWPERAAAKIRYAHRPAPCRVIQEQATFTVLFDEPQEAVAPGQSVVLYDGDVVAGGGVIREAIGEA